MSSVLRVWARIFLKEFPFHGRPCGITVNTVNYSAIGLLYSYSFRVDMDTLMWAIVTMSSSSQTMIIVIQTRV